MISITRPDPVPIREVAAFVNDCWRHTYAGILDPDFLANLTTDARAGVMGRQLGSGSEILVAYDGDELVAMSMYGPSHITGWEQAGLLEMLYVRPDRIGTGLGHQLLTRSEANLDAMGYTTYVLDVVAANTHAIEFYTRHGYARVGDQTLAVIRGTTHPLDVMVKPAP